MYKRFLPYDVYERHKKIGSYINNGKSIIDIGGELEHLSQFCHPNKIVVANLTSGDVIISEDKLPFENNSFDIACAIDVLEHIQKKERKSFIDNLVKVAREKVVLSFPIYSKSHDSDEKETIDWLKKKGESVKYLEEHVKYGLPTTNEIKNITQNMDIEMTYSGNLKLNKIIFKIFMFDPKIKIIRKSIFFIKKLYYLISNDIVYLILGDKKLSNQVNRAYLTIKVNK